MTCRRFVPAVALLLILPGGCSRSEGAATAATTESPLSGLAAPMAVADDATGRGVAAWDPVPGREMIVFIVDQCSDERCSAPDRRLVSADGAGTVRELADIDEDSVFEVDDDGTAVLVSVAGESVPIPIDGSAVPPHDPPGNPPPAPTPVPGFEPVAQPVAVLGDGRYLIRGRWAEDEAFETRWQPAGGELAIGSQRPVRLFAVDVEAAAVVPISEIPGVHQRATAAGDSFGPDAVLRVDLLAGGRVVAYEVGFSGAAYDIPYSLYLAPIPPA